jgi:hypothetical protein
VDRQEALSYLDCFLFEEVHNNRIPNDDEIDITYVGDHFAVLSRETGEVHKFKVQIVESDLPEEEWNQAFEDQEWDWYINREWENDED